MACARKERVQRFARRRIRMPVSADLKNIKAHYQDGVLELHIPKDVRPHALPPLAQTVVPPHTFSRLPSPACAYNAYPNKAFPLLQEEKVKQRTIPVE
jgi:hypothetical protein